MARLSRHLGIILIFIGLLVSRGAEAANSGVTYQGRILKPNGQPVSGQFVQFKIQIRTPNSDSCLMFEEIQTQDMSSSNGSFSLTINDGSVPRTDSSGYDLDRIFANRGSFTFPTCAGGSTYTPVSGDGRTLHVLFKDETMGSWEAMPEQKLNYVPFAFESKQIAGFGIQNLVRVQESDGTMTNITPLSNANYDALKLLVAGTSSLYERAGRLGGSSIVGTPAAGQVLSYNGTSWTPITPTSGSSGTVTSITAGSGLTSSASPITTTGTIELATVGSGGTGFKITYDAYGRVTTAAALTEADIPTLSTAGKVSGSAITSGTIGGSTIINTTGAITTTGALTAGSFTTSGASSTGALSATSITSPAASLTALSTQGIEVYETTNNFRVLIQAPASLAGNYTLTLPLTAGAPSQVLTTNGSGGLSWSTPAGTGISALTGDVAASGTGSVAATIQPLAVTNGKLAADAVDSSKIADGSIATADIAAQAVTLAKIQNIQTNRLLGRSSAAAGSIEELTLGTGLALSGGVLSNTVTDTDSFAALSVCGNGFVPQKSGGVWTCALATSAGTNDAIMQRDSSGGFVAGAATLTGGLNLKNGALNAVTIAPSLTTTAYALTLPPMLGSNGQVLTTDASGNLSWTTPASVANAFVNGGNSFGAGASLGTNDNFALSIKTNNTTQMTVLANGNVGIGTTNPLAALSVQAAGEAGFNITNNSASTDKTWAMTVGSGGQAAHGYLMFAPGTGAGAVTSAALRLSSSGMVMVGNATNSYIVPSAPSLMIRPNSNAAGTLIDIGNNNAGTTVIASGTQNVVGVSHTFAPTSGTAVMNTFSVAPIVNQTGGANGATRGVYINPILTSAADWRALEIGSNTGYGVYQSGSSAKNYFAGSVGIGTTSPGYKLDVNGAINATAVKINGVDVVAGGGMTSLTGDVTGSGSGAVATTIAANAVTSGKIADGTIVAADLADKAVTLAKMDDIATARLIGRSTAGTGVPESISIGTGLSLSGGTLASTVTDTDTFAAVTAACANTFVPYKSGGAWTCLQVASANTASTIVQRDASGNFVSGVATLDGLKLNNGGSILNVVNPIGGAWTMTLPATAGSPNQVLTTNGSGLLSWTTPLSGNAAYVNGGNTFAATANLGTNDNFDLNVKTNNITRMTVQAGGNVGIGTTAPTTELDVYGILHVGFGSSGTIDLGNIWGAISSVGTDITVGGNSATSFGIYTSNTKRVAVDSAGNVGIGTSSPNSTLDVKGAIRMTAATSGYTGFQPPATSPSIIYTMPSTAPTNGQVLSSTSAGVMSWTTPSSGATSVGANGVVQIANGSGGFSPTALQYYTSATYNTLALNGTAGESTQVGTDNGDSYFIAQSPINKTSYYVAQSESTAAGSILGKFEAGTSAGRGTSIRTIAAETLSPSSSSSHLTFSTTPTATQTVLERMRITAAGNIGIGVTAPNEKLEIAGAVRMNGSTSGYTGFRPPATSPSIMYTLPATAPSNGQVLSSTSAGVMSWTTPSSGASVAGSANQVQYNSGSAFAASSKFTYSDSGSGSLSVAAPVGSSAAVEGAGYFTAYAGVGGSLGGVVNLGTGNMTAGNTLGQVNFQWSTSTYGSLRAVKTEAHSSTFGTALTFATTPNGSTTMSERLRIDHSGNVGIGVTAPNEKLEIAGAVRLNGSTSGYTGFQPPATSPSIMYTLPATAPTNGQVLSSTSAGVLSWTAASGGASTIDALTDARTTATSVHLGSGAGGSGSAANVTSVGYNALPSLTSGIQNTAIGSNAGYNLTTQSENVLIGYVAGYQLAGGSGGSGNTLVGNLAGFSNSTNLGASNTGVGNKALQNNNGSNNVALGKQALWDSSGSNNTAVGTDAGTSNTGSANIMVGNFAGFSFSGNDNISIGQQTFFSNGAMQTAARNTVVGNMIASNNTAHNGTDNVVVGYGAALSLTAGSDNVILGSGAGSTLTTGGSNILIGKNVSVPAANTASYLNIGGAIYGNLSTGSVGIGVTGPSEKLEVAGNVKATAFISTSDARLKKNIVKTPGLDFVRQLTGVSWQWKNNNQTDAGVIAQDVERVMPYAVVTDAKTGYKAVKYNALVAPLIESTKELYGMCQAQSRGIASLTVENQELKSEVANLKKQNAEFEERLKRLEKALAN